MLGDTLTVTLGGTGGTEKVLVKINQDGYSSEYLLREALEEFSLKVSHSKNGTRDRHYVELKNTVYATDPDESDTVRTCSSVILAKPADTAADVTDLQEALSLFLNGTNTPKIIGWES